MLTMMLDFLPNIIVSLRSLNHPSGILERREDYLSFLFYLDPRLVRLQGIFDVCSIETINSNRGNIINYLVESPYMLSYSEAIMIYESYLVGAYTSKGIGATKIEGKTAIVFEDYTKKESLVEYVNKNWEYLRLDRPGKMPKTSCKIMSKILIDFLAYDGFDVKTVTKIINDIFSEETGLDEFIKTSFTESDVRSEKTYLNKYLVNDSFSEIIPYLNETIYSSPEKICEAYNNRIFSLNYNERTKKFYLTQK